MIWCQFIGKHIGWCDPALEYESVYAQLNGEQSSWWWLLIYFGTTLLMASAALGLTIAIARSFLKEVMYGRLTKATRRHEEVLEAITNERIALENEAALSLLSR